MSDLLTVRYVHYCIKSFRPKAQGTCQRRDFAETRAVSPDGMDSAIVLQDDPLDLIPYDHVFGVCEHAVDGICPDVGLGAAAIAAANGKTAADAILTIEELPLEEPVKLFKTTISVGAGVSAALTIS